MRLLRFQPAGRDNQRQDKPVASLPLLVRHPGPKARAQERGYFFSSFYPSRSVCISDRRRVSSPDAVPTHNDIFRIRPVSFSYHNHNHIKVLVEAEFSTPNKNPRRRKARNGDFFLLNCPQIIANFYPAATSSAAVSSSTASPASSAASSFGVASSAGASGVWFS